ncbi:Ig-like domain-containing protein [Planctomycetota bacterium]
MTKMIGLRPQVWATLAKAGLQDQFVHFDYNDRLSDKKLRKERENRISTLGGALQFRFNKTKIYDGLDLVQREACIRHLVEQINMSSADSKFYYIQAGTFEVTYRALERAQPNKRKYCVLVSHSEMNEWEHKWNIKDMDPSEITNSVDDWSRGMVDCVNPVNPPAGRPAGLGASFYFTSKMGVIKNPVRPQFGNKSYTGGWPLVEWMKTSHPAYQWVHNRFEIAMDAKGCKGLDASDGGMCFAMVTGEYDYGVAGGFAALRDFLDDSLDLPAHPTPEVTRLELIDMNTNAVVRVISNGDVIDPAGLPSKVTIRAFTDPVTIDSVTFKNGGTVLLKDEVGSMYTINEDGDGRIQSWNYVEGEYNLNIIPKLGDITGANYSVNFIIGEGGGSTPADPTVAITAHKEGGHTVVVVNPWDDSGIEKVTLYTKGEQDMTYTYRGETTEKPYKYYFGALPAGTYAIRTTAYAIDDATITRKATVTVQESSVSVRSTANDAVISNTVEPKVAITSHKNGDQVSSSQAVIVTAAASHDSGIEKVILFTRSEQDTTFKGQGMLKAEPYTWNLGILPAGTYKLIFKAVARNSREAKRVISIDVQ